MNPNIYRFLMIHGLCEIVGAIGTEGSKFFPLRVAPFKAGFTQQGTETTMLKLLFYRYCISWPFILVIFVYISNTCMAKFK